MGNVWQDLKYGCRTLFDKPVFTAVSVWTLALGIGANTAVFSMINAVLLQPLPYNDPERLVLVWENIPDNPENPVTPANFFDWQAQNQSFEQMAYYVVQPFTLTGAGEPEKVEGVYSSENLFEVLGVQPVTGRAFIPGETQPGSFSVVMMSYGLWQRRFGGDPDIAGKQIVIDGYSVTVGGVMPPTFNFPSRGIDLWAATTMSPEVARERNAAHYLRVIARLKSGVTRDEAQSDMKTIAARLAEEYPKTNRYVGAYVNPLYEQKVASIRGALLILFAAAAFVLLIACANVANLLLARAAARRKEIAIRTALGATRARITQQLLVESLILAILGGAIGLLMALWGVEFLTSLMPEAIRPDSRIAIDARVLGFTAIVSLLTSLIFGLVPAWQAAKPNLIETLKEGGRDPGARGRSAIRNLLVVSEVALALVLLAGAGLMINSFYRLNHADPGYETENILSIEVFPPYSKYSDLPKRSAFYDQLIESVRNLPGVESAAVITHPPMMGGLGEMLYILDQQAERSAFMKAVPRVISPDYFRAMGISILSGRAFDERDRSDSPGVVIINETMARRSWPGEEGVGKRVKMGVAANPWLEVVGVVKDTKLVLDEEPHAQVYMTYAQTPAFGPRYLVVRAASDPTSLVAAIRSAVWELDKDQPVANIQTMQGILSEHVSRQRFNMLLLVIFAVLALALSAIGIYGVMSYLVAQGTREIGIRQALGAQVSDILRLIIGQGIVLAIAGLVIGLIAAFALTQLMKNMLFGVSATDPLTFVVVSVVLLGVALGACFVPARRATKVDPMVALRYE